MIAYSKNILVRHMLIHCVDKMQLVTGTTGEMYINA